FVEKLIEMLVIPGLGAMLGSWLLDKPTAMHIIGVLMIVAGAYALYATYRHRGALPFDPGTLRGRIGVLAVTLNCLILIMILGAALPSFNRRTLMSNVDTLLRGNSWITYDPLGYDPNVPSRAWTSHISTELSWIRTAGFDGIITFSSGEGMADIP